MPQVQYSLRYPGQYFDEESGLNYNYFRSYDSRTGRYTQGDPIGLDGGWNRFGYVDGDALGYTDSNGFKGRGERNYGKSPNFTNNPGKHWKDDPKKPGWGWQKDSQTGKTDYKPRPPWLPPLGILPLVCPLCEVMEPPPPVGPELC